MCHHVYTTSNKIRSFCSFAIFHIGISALEFNCNDTKQKQSKILKKVKLDHGPNYKSRFYPF